MRTFYFKRDPNYDKEYGNKNWLHINNCGYYQNISKDITTVRPVPRPDYHLLYVSNGEIRINGVTLYNGDAYLLFPNEPHEYTYKQIENSRYYWVHFTGNRVDEILSDCKISRGANRSSERKQEKDTLLGMLTEELVGCSDFASDYAVSLFFSFLSLFKPAQNQRRLYRRALKELEGTAECARIDEIAEIYGISTSHFIRSFKSAYGMTPNDYRQNYRISKAMNLLNMTDLSVAEVAYQCGYNDPLYFSRIFKKRTGISPSEYGREK